MSLSVAPTRHRQTPLVSRRDVSDTYIVLSSLRFRGRARRHTDPCLNGRWQCKTRGADRGLRRTQLSPACGLSLRAQVLRSPCPARGARCRRPAAAPAGAMRRDQRAETGRRAVGARGPQPSRRRGLCLLYGRGGRARDADGGGCMCTHACTHK